MCSKQGVKYFV